MPDVVELSPAAIRPLPLEPVHLRRSDHGERFVAFAFAAADVIVETDGEGAVTFAAGAVRSRFGLSAEALVGRPISSLVAPADREVLAAALVLLLEVGRLPPMLVRISDTDRSQMSLAGIVVPANTRPVRLCLSFARPPVPMATAVRSGLPQDLARAASARLRRGEACDLGLLEIIGEGGAAALHPDLIGQTLENLLPNTVANEMAPGRYGVLGHGGSAAELADLARALQATLLQKGVAVSVASRHLALDAEGLTPTQMARALRHALDVFTRDGTFGLDGAGFAGGVAGYMEQASSKTAQLRKMIREHHFNLAFQPIVAMTDRSLHHYEALIRPRPMSGQPATSPQEFMVLVEALGLADELDEAVLRVACDAAHAGKASVALNLSGQSVQNPAFRAKLVEILTAHPAYKAGLVLVEMTETAEIENVEEAQRTADALRELGVAFCLDDFGAGAADIRLLRALKPDIVKLDGSYVPGIADGGRQHAFVAGMVEIARAADAHIVAERVETEEEAAALTRLGVHYGQGWLFGRPGELPGTTRINHRRMGASDGWG